MSLVSKNEKKICILQVTPELPNPDHVNYFLNKKNCDFYFVTHDKKNKESLKFCPNTTWTETRNILYELVEKKYEYYGFVDYDFIFEPKKELGVLEQIIFDLDKMNPSVLTYYPGKGFISPFVENKEFFEKYEYSIIPFTHCGMKIIHKSLLEWFMPMETKFGGGVESAHLFNILEIPFLRNVVCSHNMVYRNSVSDIKTPHNKSGILSKKKMDELWDWVYPNYKKTDILEKIYKNNYKDSLTIKDFFVKIFTNNNITPIKQEKKDDHYNVEKINNFFNLDSEVFNNRRKS